jgi:hypothetical protein
VSYGADIALHHTCPDLHAERKPETALITVFTIHLFRSDESQQIIWLKIR